MLGILAAGAAIGARDVANKMRDTENATNFELNREALRQQYLTRRIETKAASDQMLADKQAANELAKHERTRAAKQEDSLSAFERNKELKGMDIAARSSLEDKRQSNRKALLDMSGGSAGGVKGAESISMRSTIGKEAQDYVNSGQVRDFNEGLMLATQREAARIIQANPMNAMLPPQELAAQVKELSRELYGKQTEQNNEVAAPQETRKRLKFGVDF